MPLRNQAWREVCGGEAANMEELEYFMSLDVAGGCGLSALEFFFKEGREVSGERIASLVEGEVGWEMMIGSENLQGAVYMVRDHDDTLRRKRPVRLDLVRPGGGLASIILTVGVNEVEDSFVPAWFVEDGEFYYSNSKDFQGSSGAQVLKTALGLDSAAATFAKASPLWATLLGCDNLKWFVFRLRDHRKELGDRVPVRIDITRGEGGL